MMLAFPYSNFGVTDKLYVFNLDDISGIFDACLNVFNDQLWVVFCNNLMEGNVISYQVQYHGYGNSGAAHTRLSAHYIRLDCDSLLPHNLVLLVALP